MVFVGKDDDGPYSPRLPPASPTVMLGPGHAPGLLSDMPLLLAFPYLGPHTFTNILRLIFALQSSTFTHMVFFLPQLWYTRYPFKYSFSGELGTCLTYQKIR